MDGVYLQPLSRSDRAKIRLLNKPKRKKAKKKQKPIPVEIREFVLKRDKKKCISCGCKTSLHIHHIIHREDGGTDDASNLQTLCDLCHAEKHRGEPIYNLMAKNLLVYKTV